MKIAFLIILAACLQVSARGLAQQITIVGKNMTMREVFDKIEDKTGYGVFYNHDLLTNLHKVTLSEHDATIDQVLRKCFVGQPVLLDYTINGHTINVFKKVSESPTSAAGDAIPPIDVKGKITDSLGSPLIGAAVSIDGTEYGTTTDENGEFHLKAVNPSATVIISYVGYFNKKIALSGRTTLMVALMVNNKELSGATVSSNGYVTGKSVTATGSTVTVNTQLFNMRVSSDPISRLEGNVSGLLFNRNTSSGNELSIRGRSTLFANASPLIVIDNFPYDGDINNINPNDIQSVTVLKDAAAASIWGVQSGNGVIVLTTKKGKRNQPLTIEVNANTTVSNKQDLYYSRAFLPSTNFIDVEESLFSQGYYDAQLSSSTRPPVSPVVQLLADERAGIVDPNTVNTLISQYRKIDVRHQLSEYFYQQAIAQQYSINLRGGTDKSDYIFSAGFDNNRAGLVGNSNKRITLMGNSNYYLTKNLTFSAGITYTQTAGTTNSPVANIVSGGNYSNAIYPYASLVGSNGQALAIVKDHNYSWVTDSLAHSGLQSWQYKPYDELRFADNEAHLLDNKLNLGLKYNLPIGFKLSVLYQYETSKGNAANYYSDSTYYARNLINTFAQKSGSNWKYPIPIGGILQQSNSSLSSHRLRSQLEYGHRLGTDHELTGIVGAEVSQAVTSSYNPAIVYGYNKDNGSYQLVDNKDYFTQQPNVGSSQIPSGISFYQYNNRFVSYYSNALYTYKGRYSLSGSGRIDKSNLFGVKTNQKSVPLYSIGGAWNASKESFYHVKWLPYLNFRATYGYNGNIDKSATAVTTFSVLSNNYFFGQPFGVIAHPGNPQLRWERTRMINLGVDYGLQNNVVSGSFEYYFKKGTDLFSNAPLPPSTGWTTFYGNNADIKGHGLDLVLNANIVRTRNFTWTSNFLFSYSLDKVSAYKVTTATGSLLVANASSGTIAPEIGKPIFSVYGYRFAGLTHDTGDPQGYQGGKPSTDYANIIGNATVDSLHFVGSARPLDYGSFRNTISYKALSLSFNILYKFNYYFKRSSISYNQLFGYWVGNSDFLKRWQKPGDELSTNVPSMPSSITNLNPNREAFYNNSDALATKGDHVRLQDITLSYDISVTHFTNNVFKGLRVYAYVNNVGILWRANHQHLDPDVFGDGIPLPRSYALGATIRF